MNSETKSKVLNGTIAVTRVATPGTLALLAFLAWRALDKLDAIRLTLQEVLVHVRLHGGIP